MRATLDVSRYKDTKVVIDDVPYTMKFRLGVSFDIEMDLTNATNDGMVMSIPIKPLLGVDDVILVNGEGEEFAFSDFD